MSRVDKIFQDNLALIMSQPWEEVKRPVYGDGTGVKVKLSYKYVTSTIFVENFLLVHLDLLILKTP